MRLNSLCILGASLIGIASCQNYSTSGPLTIDPDTVPLSTRLAWCRAQTNSCPQICGGEASQNTCDTNTLNYTCICSNGNSPNITDYADTVPSFVCAQWKIDCVEAHPNDLTGQTGCLSVVCGDRNGSETTPISSTEWVTTTITESSTTATITIAASELSLLVQTSASTSSFTRASSHVPTVAASASAMSTNGTSTPATSTSTASTSASPNATSTPHTANDSGLSTSAKAGIGVGVGVAGLLVITAILLYSLRRRRRSIGGAGETVGPNTEKRASFKGDGHSAIGWPWPWSAAKYDKSPPKELHGDSRPTELDAEPPNARLELSGEEPGPASDIGEAPPIPMSSKPRRRE